MPMQDLGSRAGEAYNFNDPQSLSFFPGLLGPDPHYTAQVGLLPLAEALKQGRASQCPFSGMQAGPPADNHAESRAIVPRTPDGKLLLAACTALPHIVRNAKYILYDIQADMVRLRRSSILTLINVRGMCRLVHCFVAALFKGCPCQIFPFAHECLVRHLAGWFGNHRPINTWKRLSCACAAAQRCCRGAPVAHGCRRRRAARQGPAPGWAAGSMRMAANICAALA